MVHRAAAAAVARPLVVVDSSSTEGGGEERKNELEPAEGKGAREGRGAWVSEASFCAEAQQRNEGGEATRVAGLLLLLLLLLSVHRNSCTGCGVVRGATS